MTHGSEVSFRGAVSWSDVSVSGEVRLDGFSFLRIFEPHEQSFRTLLNSGFSIEFLVKMVEKSLEMLFTATA